MSSEAERESEQRFHPPVNWRDFFIIAGVLIGFGAAQTQILVNSRRLDRIEQQGSPQLNELRSLADERDKKLGDMVATLARRADVLDLRVNAAVENDQKAHSSAETHLHAVDQRLERDEAMIRVVTSDVMGLMNEKLAVIVTRLSDLEAVNRQAAKEIITTVGDRITGIDKRLAVTEQMLSDVRSRVDGYTRQQELMMRDLGRELGRQPIKP